MNEFSMYIDINIIIAAEFRALVKMTFVQHLKANLRLKFNKTNYI